MSENLINAIALAAVLPMGALAQALLPGSHFVENWDMNSDGHLTLAEATEKRGELFYMFDQNEDGMLDNAEYTLFDETREADMQANAGGFLSGPMVGIDQGLMRDFNDTDGDGLVSQEEFLARVPEWFRMMDRNGDDLVTTDDFVREKG